MHDAHIDCLRKDRQYATTHVGVGERFYEAMPVAQELLERSTIHHIL